MNNFIKSNEDFIIPAELHLTGQLQRLPRSATLLLMGGVIRDSPPCMEEGSEWPWEDIAGAPNGLRLHMQGRYNITNLHVSSGISVLPPLRQSNQFSKLI